MLTTFSDVVTEVRKRVCHDARAAGVAQRRATIRDAVGLYLALAISRFGDRNNALCTWDSGPTGTRSSTGGSARTASLRNLFARQAIPMAWDYGEANPFSDSGGGYNSALEWIEPAVRALMGSVAGTALSADAGSQTISRDKLVSTDPPYFDNISYADLSDFFYVWLRRSLRPSFPDVFTTVAVPKADELVASAHRHGGRERAEAFFLDGMTKAMHRLAEQSHPAFPVTIYYAFKQSETETSEGTASTGWETFLDAVIRAGFAMSGTWPMRTELGNRMIGSGTNALASSIILVCRRRSATAPIATRREFVLALKDELPMALAHLQRGNVAPVDLAQAAIGPGMAVYTRYATVLDAEGRPLSVREALALINQTLDEALAEQEGDFDVDSRWALTWFDQYAFGDGPYGEAEVLATAKANSIAGLGESGILTSRAGKVRLLPPDELPLAWDPEEDRRTNVWEMLHHLIRVFEHAGEGAAAQLLTKYGSKGDVVRELAYRLYNACERKKRAKEAGWYNALVQSWPEIARLAKEQPSEAQQQQATLFDQE
jgi:putative DNA methylase